MYSENVVRYKPRDTREVLNVVAQWDPHALRTTSLEFLRTELHTARTFISVAQTASDDNCKLTRNRQNARKAYDAVVRFMPVVVLTRGEQADLENQLMDVKAALQELGEVFP